VVKNIVEEVSDNLGVQLDLPLLINREHTRYTVGAVKLASM